MSDHSTLTGLNVHQPWHYVQDTDPGAVGAGLTWFSKASSILKYRNDANTAWITIIASSFAQPALEILVPAGSTTSAIQAIIDAAPNGSTVILANETHIQTAVLSITHPLTLRGHSGGLSKLKALGNITDSYGGGTAHQIRLGWFSTAPSGIHLHHFAIEHDRVTSPTMRTLAIDISDACSNVEIDHIHFIDITSDCVIVRPYDWAVDPGCTNLSLHDCIADEFWEGFFNYHSGYLANCWVYNNVGTVTNNPNPSTYQGPMMLEINLEQAAGTGTNINMSGNSCTVTGTASGATNSGSLGFVMNINGPFTVGNEVYYDKIYCMNNYFSGFFYGMYIGATGLDTGTKKTVKTLIEITDNQVLNSYSTCLYIHPNSDETGTSAAWRTGSNMDWIVCTRNTGNTNAPVIDQSLLTAPSGAGTDIINIVQTDNDWT